MFTLAGNFYKWMKKRSEKNLTIIILGLDNAGKTTLLFSLKNEISESDTTPTVGFRQSKIVNGRYTIQWFDVGGAKNFRRVWTNYYSEVRTSCFLLIICLCCASPDFCGALLRSRRVAGAWGDLRRGRGSRGPVGRIKGSVITNIES